VADTTDGDTYFVSDVQGTPPNEPDELTSQYLAGIKVPEVTRTIGFP
jgi:hypothetical protein